MSSSFQKSLENSWFALLQGKLIHALPFLQSQLLFIWLLLGSIICPFDVSQNILHLFRFTDRSFLEESLLAQGVLLQASILMAGNAYLLIHLVHPIIVMLLAVVASLPFCVDLAKGFLQFFDEKTQIGLIFRSLFTSAAIEPPSQSSWGALFQVIFPLGAFRRSPKSLQPFSCKKSMIAC